MPRRNKTRILTAKDVAQTINAENVQLITNCTNYKKKGHFTKRCRTKKKYGTKQNNIVNALEESSNYEDDLYISAITTGNKKNWTEKIQVGNVKFTVKLDTGAECNVLPKYLIDKTKASLKPSQTKNLISCTDDKMTDSSR